MVVRKQTQITASAAYVRMTLAQFLHLGVYVGRSATNRRGCGTVAFARTIVAPIIVVQQKLREFTKEKLEKDGMIDCYIFTRWCK